MRLRPTVRQSICGPNVARVGQSLRRNTRARKGGGVSRTIRAGAREAKRALAKALDMTAELVR